MQINKENELRGKAKAFLALKLIEYVLVISLKQVKFTIMPFMSRTLFDYSI